MTYLNVKVVVNIIWIMITLRDQFANKHKKSCHYIKTALNLIPTLHC